MKTIKFSPRVKEILADTVTPVSIYLKLRDIYPNTLLLESSDYHGNENSYSFICIKPEATFMVEQNNIRIKYPDRRMKSGLWKNTVR